MDSHNHQKSVAVVIGSGGAKCAAALGLWKTLTRSGIGMSMAVGASAGSLYAALMALGYDVSLAEQMTFDFWTGDLMEGYTSNLRAALSGEVRFTEQSGLIDDGPLMERLQSAFGTHTFADTKLPLYIVATDLWSGEPVILSSGSILDAVRASIAIPMIFPPWEIAGRLLVDGAVCDPLPVDVAIRAGADVIVAMGFEIPVRHRLRSYTAVAQHFNSIYMNNILKSSFAFHNLAHHAEVVAILPEFDRSVGTFDAHLFPYVVELGGQATEAQIGYLHRLIGGGNAAS